ncbi:hypothetical protein PV327_008293 [Microctonus hyperodae]|uniref:Small ribosomal subunit protein uS2 C-terminal domain-containing protein n=1 Tax=Microctonus hyperodae TaxID=165561 RepID=A0AA39KGW5_MICHY|nr:hypothetical protein PV327_008293 [Microctonus hyperodae]
MKGDWGGVDALSRDPPSIRGKVTRRTCYAEKEEQAAKEIAPPPPKEFAAVEPTTEAGWGNEVDTVGAATENWADDVAPAAAAAAIPPVAATPAASFGTTGDWATQVQDDWSATNAPAPAQPAAQNWGGSAADKWT